VDVFLARIPFPLLRVERVAPVPTCPPSPPAMRRPNSSLSRNSNSLAVSFDRMGSLRDPVRGDDPDEHTVKAPTSYNFLEFIVIICLLLAHGGVTRISVAHDLLIFL
jgi:hypothetical protein